MKITLITALSLLSLTVMAGGPDSLKTGTFTLSGELRPRFELRNGYKNLQADGKTPGTFVSQRNRLNANWTNNQTTAYFSFQDVRIWGEDASTSDVKFMGLFEAWAEQKVCKNASFRVGRQRIILDNERLFSENNWKQAGRTHDALRFTFNPKKVIVEQIIAFNQTKENSYGTLYKPATFTNYKFLAVNFIKFKATENINVVLLNTADGFQDVNRAENMYVRYTPGGRLEYKKDDLYATVGSWYQCGKIDSAFKIRAWYLTADVKYSGIKKTDITLGTEILSGNIKDQGASLNRAFSPLYGSGHRFMGYMDLFTAFPTDTKGDGLINPYLYLSHKFGKINLKLNNHIFMLQSDALELDKYLGYECDLVAGYKFNDMANLEFGFSVYSPSDSFKTLRNITTVAPFQHFSYLQLTINPTLFTNAKN